MTRQRDMAMHIRETERHLRESISLSSALEVEYLSALVCIVLFLFVCLTISLMVI
jgi:hypothetical protein